MHHGSDYLTHVVVLSAAARVALDLSAALWQPETLTQLSRITDITRLEQFNRLAVAWQALRPSAAQYRIGKQSVTPPLLPNGSAWMEALTWTAYAIPLDAARFFAGFPVSDASWTAMQTAPAVDAQHAKAVAAALVRAAQERRVYAAEGAFVLALPDHLPWRQTPIASFAIHAQSDGLWVAGLTARGERTASWWWSPQMRTAALHQHTLAASALAHVTLAAFWHDLLVAGDEVIVAPGAPARSPAAATAGAAPPRRQEAAPLILPRRTIHLSGRREWSTAPDREIITRRSHGVRGHLRELPAEWKRSEVAEGEAGEWGFVLPDGYTFVRPHMRGGRDRDPTPVVAHARGLQTLSALIQVEQTGDAA